MLRHLKPGTNPAKTRQKTGKNPAKIWEKSGKNPGEKKPLSTLKKGNTDAISSCSS
jgi:hypothetical protein